MIPKFRAWHKEGNRMILPKHLYSIDLLKEQVTERTKCNYTFSLHSIPFDKVKFMQSTGLKDKNGKEIFEGDVLELYDCGETIGNVKAYWDGSLGAFMLDAIVVDDREPMYKVIDDEDFSYSVIGNIYENPELLEVE